MSYAITLPRRAMLDTINWAEGSPDWDELFNYVKFNNYGPHPNKIVTAGGYSSTAAGAYQILASTWYWAIDQLGLPDIMTPENQNQVAMFLIDYRGALPYIDSGDIQTAISKLTCEWASLPPGCGYGQPLRTMDETLEVYYDHLGVGAPMQTAGFGGISLLLIAGAMFGMLRNKK